MQKYVKKIKILAAAAGRSRYIYRVGNIYFDEILFAARTHPERPANTLITAEWNLLASVIPERLAFFVEKNETTPEEYLAAHLH